MKPKLAAALLDQILDGIFELDAQLEPAGLYAADCNLLFSKVIFPKLKGGGFRIAFSKGGSHAYFTTQSEKDGAYVWLETVSKIKIRQFGDRYLCDRHVDHSLRWDEKGMERLLSKLWSKSERDETALVLLIGFDSGRSPFESEFRRLEQALDWERYGVESRAKFWADPHGRGFNTGVYLWHAGPPASQ